MVVRGMLPTPTAGDAKASGSRTKEGSGAHAGVSLTDVVVHGRTVTELHGDRTTAGHLSPAFVEWMMGLPAGWTDTDLQLSGILSFPSARKSSGT